MEGRMSKTAKKKTSPSPASAFTSVAAQLLLRRGSGREAGNGDSLEFFSDLRKCQPERRVSGQTERGGPAGRTEDGRGTARRRGSSDESLSSELGKHDYDWLLTPPASPLRSPGTNSSGHSTGAPNQLGRGGSSASYAKSNSRLGRTTGHEKEKEKEKATSRLARSSSAASTQSSSSVNTAAMASHLPRVRTLSTASITAAGGSKASVISSATSSPRTPATARSTTCCRRDKVATASAVVAVARQPWSLSGKSSRSRQLTAQTSSRLVVSSPRSTTSSTCQQQVPPPTPSKRANVAARSRLAGQSTGTGSTPQASSSSYPTHTASQQARRDVHVSTRGARALTQSSSNDGVNNSRAVVVKQTGGTTTHQRWRQSQAPARNEASSVDNGSPRNSLGRKIGADKVAAQRASTRAAAVGSSGLARTGSRLRSANSNKPTTMVPAHSRKPAASQQWSSRSVMSSTSRLGLLTRTTSEASSVGSTVSSRGRRPTLGARRVPAARAAASSPAARVVPGPDAFPSTRYDAMLLREDPSNLTWLRGWDEGDQGGLELVDASLEPFFLRVDGAVNKDLSLAPI
ncbi:hypothetical protein QOZ80_5AG0377790 [Eleusine coracana subsp. coracana]|nr:hypothetical protein QOZ80_5AG0377790 [Eleusine coracana subsp. coracana]